MLNNHQKKGDFLHKLLIKGNTINYQGPNYEKRKKEEMKKKKLYDSTPEPFWYDIDGC